MFQELQNKLTLYWENNKIQASVIYCTPSSDVYDLAILKCNPMYIQNMSPAKIPVTSAKVGKNGILFRAIYNQG